MKGVQSSRAPTWAAGAAGSNLSEEPEDSRVTQVRAAQGRFTSVSTWILLVTRKKNIAEKYYENKLVGLTQELHLRHLYYTLDFGESLTRQAIPADKRRANSRSTCRKNA